VASTASQYLRILIPSLWTLSFSICLQNWLHAQSKTRAIAAVTLIVALLHPLWCYLYIYYFELGYLGGALAITTSKLSELVMLIAYIYCYSVHKETGFELSWECLQGWSHFLILGSYLHSYVTIKNEK
jgi:Na+-driven multidrug efflux pump